MLETVERDLSVVEGLGLRLTYVLNTHVHADHITGSGKIKQLLAAQGKTCQSVIAAVAGAVADVQLPDGGKVEFGGRHVVGFSTPGEGSPWCPPRRHTALSLNPTTHQLLTSCHCHCHRRAHGWVLVLRPR